MTSGELIKRLHEDGWIIRKMGPRKVKGSHVTLTKPGWIKIITISHPRKDVSKGLIKQVQQISGIAFI
ncbi:type II toxin-antitoxin system HicA family toxin [Sodalis sp. dw_96]|uniref:type II toxin-antitoxin system HicA family toxin n=1 Tax=Sodalis sp. dw_96 TaxID=2719794 RepID=UPI001BD263E3|nr:type II toxin-antitoxin system HicA family toxin [Sodalis sp. dw_96]